MRTLVFLFFSGTPLHKLCTWLLLKKILGGTLYSDLWFGGTHLLVLCSGLLLIQWFFPGISAEQIFSAELNITKCAPEFCWSCFFSAEIQKSGDACCMFISQGEIYPIPSAMANDLGSWLWGPWSFKTGLPNHENGLTLLARVGIWNVNNACWAHEYVCRTERTSR